MFGEAHKKEGRSSSRSKSKIQKYLGEIIHTPRYASTQRPSTLAHSLGNSPLRGTTSRDWKGGLRKDGNIVNNTSEHRSYRLGGRLGYSRTPQRLGERKGSQNNAERGRERVSRKKVRVSCRIRQFTTQELENNE